MRNRIFMLVVICMAALRAEAGMVRVAAVEDGRTLIVERDGKRERVTLAGVAILDEAQAKTMLEWTLVSTPGSTLGSTPGSASGSTWVMLEKSENGVLVYRSPDALFINRELVVRGFARATLPDIEPRSHVVVTYLGTLDLREPRAARAEVKNAPASGNGSGTRRRPPASPSPRRRARK